MTLKEAFDEAMSQLKSALEENVRLKAELEVARTRPAGNNPATYQNERTIGKPIAYDAGGCDIRPDGWDTQLVPDESVQLDREIRSLEERLHPKKVR